MLNRIQAVIVLIVVLSFTGCKEEPKTYYATAADASADRAFERGWLPEVMRTDVTEIQESHDLDSNHGWATFQYSGQFLARLGSDCVRIPSDKVVHSPFSTWPKFMKNDQTSAQLSSKNLNAYKCGTFVTVLDSGKQLGYVWQ